ncbi:enzymatic polyprotein, partial [Trifolium medium]|nr:enzymatic polyprotein [Trifolium medium]
HFASDCGNPRAVVTCYNCQKPSHFARDCRAPRAEPAATMTQGARPIAKGRVYCMGTKVSGQASNAIHEN